MGMFHLSARRSSLMPEDKRPDSTDPSLWTSHNHHPSLLCDEYCPGVHLKEQSYKPWRAATPAEKREYIQGLVTELTARWEFGDDKYESSRLGFRGDPIRHGLEEILDAFFYSFYARRMVLALEEEIRELKREIEELRNG